MCATLVAQQPRALRKLAILQWYEAILKQLTTRKHAAPCIVLIAEATHRFMVHAAPPGRPLAAKTPLPLPPSAGWLRRSPVGRLFNTHCSTQ